MNPKAAAGSLLPHGALAARIGHAAGDPACNAQQFEVAGEGLSHPGAERDFRDPGIRGRTGLDDRAARLQAAQPALQGGRRGDLQPHQVLHGHRRAVFLVQADLAKEVEILQRGDEIEMPADKFARGLEGPEGQRRRLFFLSCRPALSRKIPASAIERQG